MKAITKFLDNFYLTGLSRNLNLNLIRFFSVFMVFNFHFGGAYNHRVVERLGVGSEGLFFDFFARAYNFFGMGFLGVDFLFVLSGYFAFKSVLRAKSFPGYILGRYLRLLPAVIMLCIIPSLGGYRLKDYVDNILFLKLFKDSTYINFVTWIITYHIYFFIILGVALILFKNFWFRIGALVLLTAVVMLPAFYPIADKVRFLGFYYGLLLAVFESRVKDPAGSLPVKILKFSLLPALFLLCFIILYMAVYWPQVQTNRYYYFVFFSTIQIIAFVITANCIFRESLFRGYPKISKFFQAGSIVSYSFFILHAYYTDLNQPFIGKAMIKLNELRLPPVPAHYFLSLGVTFVLASFSFFFLERPYFTDRGKK